MHNVTWRSRRSPLFKRKKCLQTHSGRLRKAQGRQGGPRRSQDPKNPDYTRRITINPVRKKKPLSHISLSLCFFKGQNRIESRQSGEVFGKKTLITLLDIRDFKEKGDIQTPRRPKKKKSNLKQRPTHWLRHPHTRSRKRRILPLDLRIRGIENWSSKESSWSNLVEYRAYGRRSLSKEKRKGDIAGHTNPEENAHESH